VADPDVCRPIVKAESPGIETSSELAPQKSNITPDDNPLILYLNNIYLVPDYENRSLMNLLQTNEMSFSPAHITTLLDYEIEDLPLR
jgi:hypothetical protein